MTMANTAMRVEGLRETFAHLQAMGADKARPIIRKALRKGGLVMREAIAVRAATLTKTQTRQPRSSALPISALRSDIGVHAYLSDDGDLGVWIGPGKYTTHPARFVEYGHRNVKGGWSAFNKPGKGIGFRGPGREVGNVPPYPFIRPAYESTVEEMINVTADSLVTDVERIAAGDKEVA
jgi:HK97 gp10 family phage protein